mmetsp:Transcript_56038/g.126045  ORF Transcript_56038/g.126045 Transcript_56038/m.126045 type:complete len:376 (+) Transcript_56038:51-1178(+)
MEAREAHELAMGHKPTQPALYLCDLPQNVCEGELTRLLETYGLVESLRTVQSADEIAAIVEFSSVKEAQEAKSVIHHATLKGTTCRCLYLDDVMTMRSPSASKMRLTFEELDMAITSTALEDICSLFGRVLDCKVEKDEESKSCGYGFVHYDDSANVEKAMGALNGTRLGASNVVMRPTEKDDAWLFSGSRYTVNSDDADVSEALAAVFIHHHIECLDDVESKRDRLVELVRLYEPTGNQPMVISVDGANMDLLRAALSTACGDANLAFLTFAGLTTDESTKCKKQFNSGSIAVLVIEETVPIRSLGLQRQAAIMVSFDFALTLNLHMYRIARLTSPKSRMHSFFSRTRDGKVASRLAAALSEGGQDVPHALFEH